MLTKELISYVRQLFIDTYFGGDHRCKQEMENIRGILYTRACLFFSGYILIGVGEVMTGNADW